MNPNTDLTIFIPTMNRSAYIRRALYYYAAVKFEGVICIGDSSNDEEADKTKQTIESLKNQLNIIYSPCPAQEHVKTDPLGTPGEGICNKYLIENIPTKYAALSGDDDFQIPNGVEACVKYLEDNPGTLSAQGHWASFLPKDNGPHSAIESIEYVAGTASESDSAIERWTNYMRRPYSSLYGVHRTETWRRIFRDFDQVPMRYLGSELLVAGIASILGKSVEIDTLSTVTQQQADRSLNRSDATMYASLLHPNWDVSVHAYRRLIVEALAQQEEKYAGDIQLIVDREIWNLISFRMRWQLERDYPGMFNRTTYSAIRYAKRMPLLLRAYRRLWARSVDDHRVRKYTRSFTLKSLLHPSSPYHADFMPVYRAIADGNPT